MDQILANGCVWAHGVMIVHMFDGIFSLLVVGRMHPIKIGNKHTYPIQATELGISRACLVVHHN